MSNSFSRNRTAELRDSFEGTRSNTHSQENLSPNNNHERSTSLLNPNYNNDNTTERPHRPTSRYYSGYETPTINTTNNNNNNTTSNINSTSSTSLNTPTTTINTSSNISNDKRSSPPVIKPDEVIEMNEIPNVREPVNINTLDGFFQEVEFIKSDIDMINENIDAVERLHTAALASSNEQQWAQLAKELENMKNDTQKRNLDIKKRLTDLEKSNSRQTGDSDGQIRRAQFSALKNRFMDTIQRYQDIERSYQQKYRQRIERQIKIVKPEATQDEIDDILDNAYDDPQIFTQSLMQASRRGHAKAVMSEVQNRHDDIKNIEKTIVELHQLFMDMSLLVEQQQETVTAIDQNAETSAVQLEEGTKMVSKAIKTATATRAKKWCCVFLCIGICVMIAILVWWFGFNHKGVGGN